MAAFCAIQIRVRLFGRPYDSDAKGLAMKIKALILVAGAVVGAFVTPVQAADLGYAPEEYSYDYCLELAREEARANIGRMYLYPEIVAGSEAALAERAMLKEHKLAAQKEQGKEKCI